MLFDNTIGLLSYSEVLIKQLDYWVTVKLIDFNSESIAIQYDRLKPLFALTRIITDWSLLEY